MDRTAWIVIGVCAALLGLNIYMGLSLIHI